MTTHPVELDLAPPERMLRVHVVIRVLLLIVLGALGWSSIYWLLYLALPAGAALLVAAKGGEGYLAEDAPTVVRWLRWIAGAYAYLALLSDDLAPDDNQPNVGLRVTTSGAPTPASALLRLVYTIPALLLLALLSFAGVVLWIIGALFILARGRLPRPIWDFLALTLQYRLRLAAYHLSLVDRYPSLQAAPVAPAQRPAAA